MRRNTIQNALVETAVRKLHRHATADEVYEEVRKSHPSISKGTVYRNLLRLSEEGEIRKREFPGHPDRYDDVVEDHYHAICSRCGSIFDVDMEYMKDLAQAIHDTHGFQITGHDIIFRGICPKCQEELKEGSEGHHHHASHKAKS